MQLLKSKRQRTEEVVVVVVAVKKWERGCFEDEDKRWKVLTGKGR